MPKIGFRIIKTAIAVLICLIISLFRPHSIPFYAVIASIICLQCTMDNSILTAKSRVIATFIGGIYGIIFLEIEEFVPLYSHNIIRSMLIAFSIAIIIYTTVLMKKNSSAYISCVVFCSIVITHKEDAFPILFAINRMVDTLIGVAVAIIVNSIHLPISYCNNDTLYKIDISHLNLTRENTYRLCNALNHGLQLQINSQFIPYTALQSLPLKHPVFLFNESISYQPKEKIMTPISLIPSTILDQLLLDLHHHLENIVFIEVNQNHIIQHCKNKILQEYPPYSYNYCHESFPTSNISCVIVQNVLIKDIPKYDLLSYHTHKTYTIITLFNQQNHLSNDSMIHIDSISKLLHHYYHQSSKK